jgi:phosphoglycolate phosphatase-like HAD superfamily hydrolase
MEIPDMKVLLDWTKTESKLGNPALEAFAQKVDLPVIDTTYAWSLKVNQDIGELVYGMPPFPFVQESLDKLVKKADAIVVSQTPHEALEREWKENKIDKYIRLIAGQELGTKTEHLALAAKGKYPSDKILMVGDAPGDYNAAKANDVLFYPINPGHEEKSWERFYKEALDKFFSGTYKGEYENELIREFEAFLPENPSWEK